MLPSNAPCYIKFVLLEASGPYCRNAGAGITEILEALFCRTMYGAKSFSVVIPNPLRQLARLHFSLEFATIIDTISSSSGGSAALTPPTRPRIRGRFCRRGKCKAVCLPSAASLLDGPVSRNLQVFLCDKIAPGFLACHPPTVPTLLDEPDFRPFVKVSLTAFYSPLGTFHRDSITTGDRNNMVLRLCLP